MTAERNVGGPTDLRTRLLSGLVIPAHPLALTAERKMDERRQRALTRYYVAAGAGGIAVGVHTTQFAIREPRHGLLRPVLELASETADTSARSADLVKVAGVSGPTRQAIAEAELAASLGYDCGLLSLGALPDATDAELLDHCRAVGGVIPLFGFYLQPAVGGRVLGYAFWRALAELPSLVAIKIAPFNRYQTIDVVRAVADAGRDDVALYTGNDDNIIADLVTPFPCSDGARARERRIVGGLLGQWAVWTRRAVEILDHVKRATTASSIDADLLRLGAALTEANAALFDVRHDFAGCIPGIHEVLRRQGLMLGDWTLDPHERLSPGQEEEITRVTTCYPELTDDAFVAEHVEEWMR